MSAETETGAANQAKLDYDSHAATYSDYTLLPSGQLERQLVEIALGDCSGLTVLDLGGGNGVHARKAAELGAQLVDVVDVSPEMLAQGRAMAQQHNYTTTLHFHEGDVSQSLTHLPLREQGYDIVMANWIFSFADSMPMLEAMFSNIVRHLRPGGKFVGVRDADPWSPVLQSGKYGGSCKWVKPFPGGVKYLCVLHTEPPIEFEGSSLETIYSGSKEMYEKFGLEEVQTVPLRSAPVVEQDREFWREFLDRPSLAVVMAVKGR